MQVLSVNVGLPRVLTWQGRPIRTAIFKQPVTGPVALAGDNLAGDAQADLRVHGGPDKAVYAYDATHYAAWRALLPAWTDWTPGLFGENLTTDGLLETAVRVGDVFGLGTARLRAVQPRQPCYKLNARFNDGGMAARFARLGRPGIYFRVEEPGTVRPATRSPCSKRRPPPSPCRKLRSCCWRARSRQTGGPRYSRCPTYPPRCGGNSAASGRVVSCSC